MGLLSSLKNERTNATIVKFQAYATTAYGETVAAGLTRSLDKHLRNLSVDERKTVADLVSDAPYLVAAWFMDNQNNSNRNVQAEFLAQFSKG